MSGGFGYAKRVNSGNVSVSSGSSSGSSGRVAANSYGNGTVYAGGNTFKDSSGNYYTVDGSFTSPGGKVSEISGNTITTVSSQKNPSQAGTVYNTSGVANPNTGVSLEQLLAQQLATTQNTLASQRRAEEQALKAAQNAQRSAISNAYNQSRTNVNSQTEEALRQAYINSMLQERDFPQQAALWGEGGFAESNLASLRNQAQENRNQLEMQRASQIGALESDYNTQLAGIESAGIGQLANIGNTYASALANAEGNYQSGLYDLLAKQADRDYQKELAAISASGSGGQARKISLNDLYNAHDYYAATGDTAGANAIKQQINDYLGVVNAPTQQAGRGYLNEVEEQLTMFNSSQAAANYLASLYSQGLINDSEISYLQARIR